MLSIFRYLSRIRAMMKVLKPPNMSTFKRPLSTFQMGIIPDTYRKVLKVLKVLK